jgi:hypothetical protein
MDIQRDELREALAPRSRHDARNRAVVSMLVGFRGVLPDKDERAVAGPEIPDQPPSDFLSFEKRVLTVYRRARATGTVVLIGLHQIFSRVDCLVHGKPNSFVLAVREYEDAKGGQLQGEARKWRMLAADAAPRPVPDEEWTRLEGSIAIASSPAASAAIQQVRLSFTHRFRPKHGQALAFKERSNLLIDVSSQRVTARGLRQSSLVPSI